MTDTTQKNENDKARVYRIRIRPKRTYALLAKLKPPGMSWDLFLYKLVTDTLDTKL